MYQSEECGESKEWESKLVEFSIMSFSCRISLVPFTDAYTGFHFTSHKPGCGVRGKLIFDKYIFLNLIRKQHRPKLHPPTLSFSQMTYATDKKLRTPRENSLLRTAIMPKINHRNSVFVITLINHIYQLMTILQGNEIMLVFALRYKSYLA
jgi:hypothetical protein